MACLQNPNIRNKPVVVVGDESKRHGVVLSKNQMAKVMGVKTGDTVYMAREKVGQSLVCVQADFATYMKLAKQVKQIYRRYTDKVQSFGIDEAWLDVSRLTTTFKGAEELAHHIRKTVLKEVGISVSVGVSYNKVFAKLGSDYKKPNAVTVITPQNYKTLLWPLPVRALLYVGKSTSQQLSRAGVTTIGQLAVCEKDYLTKVFGKSGTQLHLYANGLDEDPVMATHAPQKCISNGTTGAKDLQTNKEVKAVIYALAEHVIKRMQAMEYWCSNVALSIKDAKRQTITRQKQLAYPVCNTEDVVQVCMELFEKHYHWYTTVRALTVSVSKFGKQPKQLNMFVDMAQNQKQQSVEHTIHHLRDKYGVGVIARGAVVLEEKLKDVDMQQGLHGIMYKK